MPVDAKKSNVLIRNKKASLLARLAICSLVSFPCFWIPAYYENKYREYDSRMGLMFALGAPFLAFAAAFSIIFLKQLFNELRMSKRLNFYFIGAAGVVLSLPNLVAIIKVIIFK